MESKHLAKWFALLLGAALAGCGGGSSSSGAGPSTYDLAVTKAGGGTGTVSGAGIQCGSTCSVSLASGTAVTLSATAAGNSTFAGWSGACSGTSPRCSVSMAADAAVTATFEPLGNLLTVTRTGTGSGRVASTSAGVDCGLACQARYASGTAVTLTATPASGATFTGWTGACTGTGTCVVAMTSAQTVSATFTAESGYASPSAGCGKAPAIPSSQYNNGSTISISAANMQRRYILNVPKSYDNAHPYRLVIAFHELNGNDKEMYANAYYHLLDLSGDSTIFVAPNGQKGGAPCTGTGTGESGCGWPNPNGSDLQLVDAVVAQLAESFCVDLSRIFVTGWSYGGSMSYETACERPQGGTASWSVRGAAIYSGGQLSGACTPSKPVAYYASHGTSDDVLSYDDVTKVGGGGIKLFQAFAAANACTYVTPTKVTSGNHVCTVLAGCATGSPTAFCSFNGGHTPDPSDGGRSWEYQSVWNFFSQL